MTALLDGVSEGQFKQVLEQGLLIKYPCLSQLTVSGQNYLF